MREPNEAQTRRGRRLFLWTSAFLVSGLLVFSAAVWGLRQAPIGLPGWVLERLVDRLDVALEPTGLTAEITRGTVALRKGLVPAVVLDGVILRDPAGGEVLRLDELDAVFSRDAALRGAAEARALRLTGVFLKLHRDKDGRLTIRLGDRAVMTAIDSPGELVTRLRAGFNNGPLRDVSEIGVTELGLTLEDARSGRQVSSGEGSMRLSRQDETLALSLDLGRIVGLSREQADGRVAFNLTSDAPDGAARAELALRGLVPVTVAGFAGELPLSELLSRLDAPVALTLGAALDTGGDLAEITGEVAVGEGTILSPGLEEPMQIDSARGSILMSGDWDRVVFRDLAFSTPMIRARGDVTLLADPQQPLDGPIAAQIALSELSYTNSARFDAPVSFDGVWADADFDRASGRVRVASLVLGRDEDRIEIEGGITPARGDKPRVVSGSLAVEALSTERLMALWPYGVKPKTRDWLSKNIKAGRLHGITAGVRKSGDAAPEIGLTFSFDQGALTPIKDAAPLTDVEGVGVIANNRLTITARRAHLQPPSGQRISLSSGMVELADLTNKSERLHVSFEASTDSAGALSLLDLPVFRGGRPANPEATPLVTPENATGDVAMTVNLRIPTDKKVNIRDVGFEVAGDITGFTSDSILKNHLLRTERLSLSATPEGATISGPARLDSEPIEVTFFRPLGGDTPQEKISHVDVTGPLTAGLAKTLGVPVPPRALSGAGRFDARITLEPGTPPRLSAKGNLAGLGMSLNGLGWRKSASAQGSLTLAGRLGPGGGLDDIALRASGLALDASANFASGGGIDALVFKRLEVGQWLNAEGRLIPGKDGRAGEVRLTGGSVDLRFLPKTGTGRGGSFMPMQIALDRAVLTDKISLTGVSGTLDASGTGTVSASVNGKAPVAIAVSGQSTGRALRVRSGNAGSVLSAAGLFASARGGALDLRLVPEGPQGQYRGQLRVTDTAIRKAPVVAELLSAISVVGALEQLSGAGITFSDVRADFQINRNQIRVLSSSAVGPSIGLSLDGLVDLGRQSLDLQGVVSPVYFLNQAGSFLTRRGEGLVGITYTIKGTTAKPRVAVNPLSVLTPGFLREIFRRPTPGQSGTAPAGN